MLSLFQYDFMQRALLAMVAMSLFSPILGVFLILRRQSLMSDTLSHVSLSGVAWFLPDYFYSHCGDHSGCISRVLTDSL